MYYGKLVYEMCEWTKRLMKPSFWLVSTEKLHNNLYRVVFRELHRTIMKKVQEKRENWCRYRSFV